MKITNLKKGYVILDTSYYTDSALAYWIKSHEVFYLDENNKISYDSSKYEKKLIKPVLRIFTELGDELKVGFCYSNYVNILIKKDKRCYYVKF